MRPLTFFVLLFLLSCTGSAPESPGIPSESAAVSSEAPREEVLQLEEGKGRYFEDYYAPNGAEALASEILGNGEPALLFFYATGCASCAVTDALLKALYRTDGFSHSTYKLDFEESADLRARLGIIAEGTLILMDGEGRTLQAVVGANETTLTYLLQ